MKEDTTAGSTLSTQVPSDGTSFRDRNNALEEHVAFSMFLERMLKRIRRFRLAATVLDFCSEFNSRERFDLKDIRNIFFTKRKSKVINELRGFSDKIGKASETFDIIKSSIQDNCQKYKDFSRNFY
ncbi:hypothetical protein CDAR_61391 [Caerostris darwini]|uniref:Uncharacterized protein n=1 Tax=Caerostris darwini TaxID=1538125 RepID=A0AAV4V1H1_9ARAC|nr:hypothetical protein CDAR_61391 [Caerostris darwini]